MHFDDRLTTVLQHRASGARAARVQFRQLVDLLGQPHGEADATLVRAAFRRLDALSQMVPTADRARIVAEVGARIRTPRLIAFLADGDAEIALAALARATLREDEWQALIPELPIRARGLLRHRRALPPLALALLDRLGVQDRVLPEPARAPVPEKGASQPAKDAIIDADFTTLDLDAYVREAASVGPEVDEPLSAEDTDPAINAGIDPALFSEDRDIPVDTGNLSALVRRIEAFQKARELRAKSNSRHDRSDAPRLPLGEDPADDVRQNPGAFTFTTDAAGRIDWAEGQMAPFVIGARLGSRSRDAREAEELASAVARRRPVVGAPMEWDGPRAVAGRWIVDAAPRFDHANDGFSGFVGRCRRPAPIEPDRKALAAADRLRQLLHELRNPVTAIQGFAEVIQQQAVGPVPHAYRAHAANIAHEAARVLAGFEDLERLAKIEAGTLSTTPGKSDFALILRRQVAQLATTLSPRVARIDPDWQLSEARVALASDCAEMLAWRMLGTLASVMGAGENASITLSQNEGDLRLVAALPAALARCDDIFSGEARTAPGQLETSLLGTGFALRLARAEARSAGGNLRRETASGRDSLVLMLPLEGAIRQSASSPAYAAERTHC